MINYGRFAVNCFFLMLILQGSVYSIEAKNELNEINSINSHDSKSDIQLKFSLPVRQLPKYFYIDKSNQLVLDFWGVVHTLNQDHLAVPQHEIVNSISLIKGQDRLRVIVQMTHYQPYEILLKEGSIHLHFPLRDEVGTKNKILTSSNRLIDVKFHGIKDGTKKIARVELIFSKPLLDMSFNLKPESLSIRIKNTFVAKEVPKIHGIEKMGTLIQRFTADTVGSDAKVLLAVNEPFKYFSYQIYNKVVIDLQPDPKNKVSLKPMAFSHSNPMPDEKKSIDKVSLNFQKIETRAVLQLLAEMTRTNIVVSDSVKGDITLRLMSVPWEQALEIILKTQGLAKRQWGGAWFVAPEDEILAREAATLKSMKQNYELAPLKVELIQVNYANAEEIVKIFKEQNNSLLSERGKISVDARTNKIWVKDTGQNITEIKGLVRRLDIPVRQVLIETRIVDVSKDFQRDLGIRFGVSASKRTSGTLSGANAIASGTAMENVPIGDRLNVDLPPLPNALGSAASGFGVALARLSKNIFLDLELKALESENKGSIISTPHVVTMDRQPAVIEQGKDIPYNQSTSSGAASIAFKKAVLRLEVTPQITPNKKIILSLSINNDEQGETITNGVIINTKAVKTQTLVNNGETIVLGGIYKTNEQNQVVRTPFFGNLPLIGNLFRSTHKLNETQELLIFITPKILETAG